jgi:DNA (cytosine-5)-methyltransferase 1
MVAASRPGPALPDSRITGNQGEQQMQAGNAVSSNVSQWLGGITVEVLS